MSGDERSDTAERSRRGLGEVRNDPVVIRAWLGEG